MKMYLTAPEAARVLGCSVDKLRREKSIAIPFTRSSGQHRRYKINDLESYLLAEQESLAQRLAFLRLCKAI